jgi:hypothetical protein
MERRGGCQPAIQDHMVHCQDIELNGLNQLLCIADRESQRKQSLPDLHFVQKAWRQTGAMVYCHICDGMLLRKDA